MRVEKMHEVEETLVRSHLFDHGTRPCNHEVSALQRLSADLDVNRFKRIGAVGKPGDFIIVYIKTPADIVPAIEPWG